MAKSKAKQNEMEVISIEKEIDGKQERYILDTSKMLFEQNEAVEKLLAKVGYQEMMANFFSSESGSNMVSRAASGAKSDAKADIKDGLQVTTVLAKLHQKLVSEGVRGDLVSLLLVPVGQEWSPELSASIRKRLVPKMTTDEVEKVLGSFFTFDKLLRSGFPSYLLGSR